jgi:hypothetical protein
MSLKLQCGCGQKVELDVRPEHASQGVQFICPTCGVDNSEVATQVVRQLFGTAPAAPVSATPPANLPAATPSVQPPSAAAAPRIRVQAHAVAASTDPETAPIPAAPAVAPICAKHRGFAVTNHCPVCQRPLCPKCMEIFGYVCSAFCRQKAEDSHIDIPIYENQSTVAQARFGRKVMRNTFAVAAVLAVFAGVWIWWEWVATMPKVMFAVTFPEKGYSGQARMNVPNQSVVLHGGLLARYDLKSKKQLWSQYLLDRKKIADDGAAALVQMKVAREKAISDGADADDWKLPSVEKLAEQMIRSQEGSLALHVHGENVWVQFPEKLVQYEWQSGNKGKEVATAELASRWAGKGAELVSNFQNESGDRVITHFDLATGDLRKEEFARPKPAKTTSLAKVGPGTSTKAAVKTPVAARPATGAKVLLASTSKSPTKAIDPKAAAQRYQNMPLPSKLALPATLAANANQERLKAALRGDSEDPIGLDSPMAGASPDMTEHSSFLFTGNGFVELSVKLLETKIVERKVMKAAPKKAALDGDVSTGNSMAIANDLLNEMQRENLGDTVKEDVSRYQVELRKQDAGSEEWSGEVNGSPQFFGLKTVNILAAGDSLFAFDKNLKKLWEGKLSTTIVGGDSDFDGAEESSQFGRGPCVEHGDRLYIFDQTVLTCYEKSSGKPVWRLPSVGTAGLFFDDQGHIYVNTTTASPDSVKYSRQIDLSSKTRNQVVKLEENTGKVLWRTDGEGLISYLSGKFIYTMEMHPGDSDEGEGLFSGMKTGLEIPAHVRIKRISPGNGRVLWEHYQAGAPLDVQFDGNRIELLFRKELQVLTFMTL